MTRDEAIEAAAKATWERCRSLSDRKSELAWEAVSVDVQNAWREGAAVTLNAIQFDALSAEVGRLEAGREIERTAIRNAMTEIQGLQAVALDVCNAYPAISADGATVAEWETFHRAAQRLWIALGRPAPVDNSELPSATQVWL